MPAHAWLNPKTKERLCEAQNHRCAICGKRMGATGDRRDYPTFEHVMPLARGGSRSIDNIVITCRGCNGDRNNYDEWSRYGQYQRVRHREPLRPHPSLAVYPRNA